MWGGGTQGDSTKSFMMDLQIWRARSEANTETVLVSECRSGLPLTKCGRWVVSCKMAIMQPGVIQFVWKESRMKK